MTGPQTGRAGPHTTGQTGPHTTGQAGATSAAPHDEPAGRPLSSVGDVVGQIGEDLSRLVQQELELAKAELAASAKRGGKGAGMLGGAGVAAHFVLLFLSLALWWGLGDLLGLGWSALVVALVWAIVAGVLAVIGRKQLKDIEGMPRTVETTKEIPDALKGNEDRR
jgi:hypothetical protein